MVLNIEGKVLFIIIRDLQCSSIGFFKIYVIPLSRVYAAHKILILTHIFKVKMYEVVPFRFTSNA